VLNNYFVSDILSLRVNKKESRIEGFEDLIRKEDIRILVAHSSNAEKVLRNVK